MRAGRVRDWKVNQQDVSLLLQSPPPLPQS
jgi:hypothetical protein